MATRIAKPNRAPEPGRYTCEVVLSYEDREEIAHDIEVDVEPFYLSGKLIDTHSRITLHYIDPIGKLIGIQLRQEETPLFGGDVQECEVIPNGIKVLVYGTGRASGRFIYPEKSRP